MKNLFTEWQVWQIKKMLDSVMNCGVDNIVLCGASPNTADHDGNTTLAWYTVRAYRKGAERQVYEIDAGQFIVDRNRRLALSLDVARYRKAADGR